MPRCFVCNREYESGRELTCSDRCHQELAKRLLARFGEFKKVVRQSTGVAYKVPIRDIIEKGIREQDLDRYPIWNMEIFVGQDEGEWPKGTRVRKTHSNHGDTHQDGALGTIVGALGPFSPVDRAETILRLAEAEKNMAEDVVCIYWVEWDDIPGIPVAIADYRLELAEK